MISGHAYRSVKNAIWNTWLARVVSVEDQSYVSLRHRNNLQLSDVEEKRNSDDKVKDPDAEHNYLGNFQGYKTESFRKLSNFNYQWTKTLYQNNLKNIAFFFTFFFNPFATWEHICASDVTVWLKFGRIWWNFCTKWSCKDLLIESIKLLTFPPPNIWYSLPPLEVLEFFFCNNYAVSFASVIIYLSRYSLDFSGLLRSLFSIHRLLKLSLFCGCFHRLLPYTHHSTLFQIISGIGGLLTNLEKSTRNLVLKGLRHKDVISLL